MSLGKRYWDDGELANAWQITIKESKKGRAEICKKKHSVKMNGLESEFKWSVWGLEGKLEAFLEL